jgi:hypothetical protein
MAVLSDYKCEKHGYFESRKAVCPMKGCDAEVYQVFLQAPGLVSSKTKSTDKTVEQLAIEFNMSDIKSTREGENQSGYLKRNNKFTEKEYADAEKFATRKRGVNKDKLKPAPVVEQPREPRAGDNAIWGGGQNGMNMQSILAGQFSRPVGPSLGKEAEITSILPSQAGISSGPKIASFMKDQDNLQLKK